MFGLDLSKLAEIGETIKGALGVYDQRLANIESTQREILRRLTPPEPVQHAPGDATIRGANPPPL